MCIVFAVIRVIEELKTMIVVQEIIISSHKPPNLDNYHACISGATETS